MPNVNEVECAKRDWEATKVKILCHQNSEKEILDDEESGDDEQEDCLDYLFRNDIKQTSSDKQIKLEDVQLDDFKDTDIAGCF